MIRPVGWRLTPPHLIALVFLSLAALSLVACAPEAEPEAQSKSTAESPPAKQKSGEPAEQRQTSSLPRPEPAMPEFPESDTDAQEELYEAVPWLVGTEWWVEDIDGAAVIDNSRTTIAFPEVDRVAGDGGCNRYAGPVKLDEERMSFGRLSGRLMVCPKAFKDQDWRFHQALSKVVAWEVRDTGSLHLLNAAGETVVRASEVQ